MRTRRACLLVEGEGRARGARLRAAGAGIEGPHRGVPERARRSKIPSVAH